MGFQSGCSSHFLQNNILYLSILSLIQDFMSPHIKMFSDKDFGNLGANIDLTVPVINMDDSDFGMKTRSIDVMSGV